MSTSIKKAAERYAKNDLGRTVEIVSVLNHGSEAMALCAARDNDVSFSLALQNNIITGYGWSVTEECDVEDFLRNAKRDGVQVQWEGK